MKTIEILHFLRNPYGLTDDERRKVMLEAANEIERWINSFENMKEWAIENGVNIHTTN
jgi:hypothetical protein